LGRRRDIRRVATAADVNDRTSSPRKSLADIRRTKLAGRPRSRQHHRDHDDDHRDEDHRLSARHSPHCTPPICTNSHEIKPGIRDCKYPRRPPSRGPRINSRPQKDPDDDERGYPCHRIASRPASPRPRCHVRCRTGGARRECHRVTIASRRAHHVITTTRCEPSTMGCPLLGPRRHPAARPRLPGLSGRSVSWLGARQTPR
jgi:hypothetical protein